MSVVDALMMAGCIYSLDLIEEDVRWNDLVRTEFEKRSA